MNLTSARRRLSQVGYFQASATQVYTFCPDCRGRLNVEVVAWAKPRERVAALAYALVEHTTTYDCEAEA